MKSENLVIKYTNEKNIPGGILDLMSEQCVYLYGNSARAHETLRRMKIYNVRIDGVISGKEYIESNPFFEGFEVQDAERIIKTGRIMSIVAGFDILAHRDLVARIASAPNVRRIYVMDGCDTLYRNKFVFPNEEKIKLIDSYYSGVFSRGLSYNYYQQYKELFCQTFNWLEDEKSRKTMQLYLDGHINLTEYPMLPVWEIDDVEEQYFPQDIITLSSEETFVDCGAYIGDTYESFVRHVSDYKRYYAIEPDIRRKSELCKIAQNDDRVIYCNVGTGDAQGILGFSMDKECGEIADQTECNNQYIQVDTIDNIVDGSVTFVKMDVEGAELQSLKGGVNTIQEFKPKLAICVYHKRDDLVKIPQFIKSINPSYKLFLRAHFPYVSELVLYAL